jgi:hypothetical protein
MFVFFWLIPVRISDPNDYLNRDQTIKLLKLKYPYDKEYTSRQTSFPSPTLKSLFFHDIKSNSNGGAIYYSVQSVNLVLDFCCFCFISSNNGDGGAMYLSIKTAQINKTSGYQCEASYSFGKGSFIFLHNMSKQGSSAISNSVTFRCPYQNSSSLKGNHGSVIGLKLTSSKDFEFSTSNFSLNVLTRNEGHLTDELEQACTIRLNTFF